MKKLFARILNLFMYKGNLPGADLAAVDGLVIFVYRDLPVISPTRARQIAGELQAFADIAERGFSQ